MKLKDIALTLQVLIALIPVISVLVSRGAIRAAAEDEIVAAIAADFDKRFEAAKNAKVTVDEKDDPYNRSR